MKRLSKKLRSQSGASILMALLMLLVCCMVAASVLAAAASNAGKARSNRVEQQKYLTLSSAIQLVADEIQKAEYKGKYTVYEWTEKITTTVTTPIINPDGSPGSITTSTTESKDYFWCEQMQAAAGVEYTCGDLTALIPLEKELDEIFSRQFAAKGKGYQPLVNTIPDEKIEDSKVRTLTVTLPNDLEGYPYPGSGLPAYQAPDVATVEVQLDHATRHIKLTAWLGDGTAPTDKSDTMIAELVVKEGTAPALTYDPAGRTAGTAPWVSGVGLVPGQSSSNENTTATPHPTDPADPADPVTRWELHWIKKGAA